MTIQDQIIHYRITHGISEEAFAKKVCVSVSDLYAPNWTIHTLLLLANFFDISFDTLICEDLPHIQRKLHTATRTYKRNNFIFKGLFFGLFLFSPLLIMRFGELGIWIIVALWALTLRKAYLVGRYLQNTMLNNYREIIAYYNGTTLLSIEKARHSEKTAKQKRCNTLCKITMAFYAITLIITILTTL